MSDGSRTNKVLPRWDARIQFCVTNRIARDACYRAGFIWLREVAPYTERQLTSMFDFTPHEAAMLHEWFMEDGKCESMHFGFGTRLLDNAWMLILEARRDDSSSSTSWKILSDMFGARLVNRQDLDTLGCKISAMIVAASKQ